LAGQKADLWQLRQSDKVLDLKFLDSVGRPERNNIIDIYLSDDFTEVTDDGNWQKFFSERPEVFSKSEQKAFLAEISGVSLASDAFFPFDDNIVRAYKSGVSFVAQPGGSVRDDVVIDTCNKLNMAMAFTGMRLFHH
ncbi:MAG: phosphoribosylaminoimidazolecarboxamide formyltransferase, partial [Clostridia bacterium]